MIHGCLRHAVNVHTKMASTPQGILYIHNVRMMSLYAFGKYKEKAMYNPGIVLYIYSVLLE